MRNNMLCAGMLWLCVGCVDNERSTSGAPELPPARSTPRVLENATGTWIAVSVIDAALNAKCPGCELAVIHEVEPREGAFDDAITVFATRPTDSAMSPLCTMSRTYTASADQMYPDAGELVDYEAV